MIILLSIKATRRVRSSFSGAVGTTLPNTIQGLLLDRAVGCRTISGAFLRAEGMVYRLKHA